MLGHLWTKHQIDKDHPDRTSTRPIIKAMHIITKRYQEKLTQKLVKFIIKDCQSLNILCCGAFRQFLNDMKPGFKIPCELSIKKKINQAYDWSHEQLFDIVVNGGFVNLMTDYGVREQIKNRHLIEPPITTITAEELYDLVKAASYFSLKEYWDIPEKAALIVSFLDPQIKNLKFINNESIQQSIISMVQELCNKKEHHCLLAENTTKNSELSNMNSTMTNDLVSDLYSIEESDEIDEKSEVTHYLHEPIQKRLCDPLALA
ncbi:12293_t:CDS:2 [Dentiscutata erythropus]|uniref:12293_t:CDS:1 n=1 Tax=Dentiscutata erythropus TaxID=1348616 RepID=A0A9N8ZY84_9GLOM|nr:12293_t:CDS:2 [Dentiscutata erythropus]